MAAVTGLMLGCVAAAGSVGMDGLRDLARLAAERRETPGLEGTRGMVDRMLQATSEYLSDAGLEDSALSVGAPVLDQKDGRS